MGLEGLRILVVEDAADIRDVFAVLLKAEGADVVATGTGREAADIISERQFDVVLSDLGLPDVPGDVLIRQILASSKGRTRVIVVTGYGEPFVSRARQAGILEVRHDGEDQGQGRQNEGRGVEGAARLQSWLLRVSSNAAYYARELKIPPRTIRRKRRDRGGGGSRGCASTRPAL